MSIAIVDLGAYDTASFTQRDFNNMRKDDCAAICYQDVDLVVKRFEACKEKNGDFFLFHSSR